VEGLRVSIGMEAYAQRDPLVQYKSKASELFRSLLADIRSAVISRMYTMQPRRGTEASAERGESQAAEPEAMGGDGKEASSGAAPAARPVITTGPVNDAANDANRKKRKRH
jgi:preprotein translocase subunit SecA